MSEPESEMGDSQGTELSSVRSDESVTLTNEGNKIKVKDTAFDIVKCGADDATSAEDDKATFKQALKISLMEKDALEKEKVLLELEVQRLKGENSSLVFEVRVLRAAVADTCAYRRYFGRPCVVREGRFTVHETGFTVPTD
jgi:hypothetical protein